MSFFTPAFIQTCVALALCGAIGVFSFHRHFRPHDKLEPRMIPWSIIAMACLATCFMLIVHLVNVLGFETGNR